MNMLKLHHFLNRISSLFYQQHNEVLTSTPTHKSTDPEYFNWTVKAGKGHGESACTSWLDSPSTGAKQETKQRLSGLCFTLVPPMQGVRYTDNIMMMKWESCE